MDPTGQGRIQAEDNKALQNLQENRSGAYESANEATGRCYGWCGAYTCCCENPYKRVPEGFTGVILRFDKFHKLLAPGLYFINPEIDRLTLVDKRERAQDLNKQRVVTKDNMSLIIDAVLFYKIVDTHRAMFRVQGVQNLIIDLAVTTLRNVIGNMSMQQFLENRDHLDDQMLSKVEQTAAGWGLRVTRVLVQDVQLPPEFRNTMSASAVAKKIGDAKRITAQADVEAARLMREAAEALSTDAALQIRYLDALELLTKTANPKLLFFPPDYRDIGTANEHLDEDVTVGLLSKTKNR